ncbi:hypothetical protein AB6N24_17515 [Cellulomonas sp. 179-A 4D5 NHS]|uniref:hypothetical protein n=1 Tax=Cellulomonas sp. 179-A 4D5 NHS TaxID=3142378 RepID=UPI0039A39841
MLTVPEFCDLPVIGYTTVCVGADVAENVAEVVDFAVDPLGYLAEQLQAASAGLTTTVLPAMEQLTHPDLSVDWFVGAYKVSFALSIFVFVALLGWNFVQLTRRRVSGDEVVETLAFYAPMFFAGVLLGPLLGNLLLRLTGALSDSLIRWGVGSTIGSTTTQLTTAITTGDPAQMAGGAIVAIAVYGVLLVALGLAFLTLLVMLVTLYLSGAVLPLSLVWIVNPRRRERGLKVTGVWVGVCFSHVLLFLMLGIAFHLVTGQVSEAITDPGLRMVAQLATAAIALLMATLSPFALLAFAPVGPTSGGTGASMRLPSSSSAGRGGRTVSQTDSQTAQLARSDATTGDETADDPGPEPTPGPGGLSTRLLESRKDSAGPSSTTSMEPDGTDPSGGQSSTSGEPAEAPAAAPAASGTGAVATAGDTTSDVGDKAAAAGTAAEVTGVGAPVGAALQGLAVVAKTAGSAASTTARLAESAGSMAAEHMDHANPRNKN